MNKLLKYFYSSLFVGLFCFAIIVYILVKQHIFIKYQKCPIYNCPLLPHWIHIIPISALLVSLSNNHIHKLAVSLGCDKITRYRIILHIFRLPMPLAAIYTFCRPEVKFFSLGRFVLIYSISYPFSEYK